MKKNYKNKKRLKKSKENKVRKTILTSFQQIKRNQRPNSKKRKTSFKVW